MKKNLGFTLIEVMVVVIIVAILAAIVIPSYKAFARRGVASQAEQEIQRLATLLEKHRSRNFSYANFTVAGSVLPEGKTGADITYNVYVRDAIDPSKALNDPAAMGVGWVILAEANSEINHPGSCPSCNPLQTGNYSFLMMSNGMKCKTKMKLAKDDLTASNLSGTTPCGGGGEDW
ncbi:prepilin-type N-terminal cleavage/methylation domain-containing protein [Acinetobacter gyllenbergii]|uniref:prepilin-type N-terminal cleavage/methylation domain-containing protein n=1 Tax=Acinetobacter gyllenbergii TaxID=134534 RepID=UPI000806CB36|nr:prepilin-type N-terminal cleavage/methylation domain-containing protein [Acinetobacter gyllenbergii]OBY74285.1 Type IV pilin PilA [Acinetobacter gyllenbergii]